MNFPKDIEKKMKEDFPPEQIRLIKSLIQKKVEGGLNVGNHQFIRSVIFLAEKDFAQLKKALTLYDDPRDIVDDAETKSGKLGHWFAIPFDEIEALNGQKYDGAIFKENQLPLDDGLPF